MKEQCSERKSIPKMELSHQDRISISQCYFPSNRRYTTKSVGPVGVFADHFGTNPCLLTFIAYEPEGTLLRRSEAGTDKRRKRRSSMGSPFSNSNCKRLPVSLLGETRHTRLLEDT
ncbi:hypothetical protein C5167_014585 [Papaver somniferum]|uniref:Uncharacterized protein n=1 Tax=Papaver somniferum TaxID=3469 RepID=A0A4Y7J7W8_PAPSO|nr:hypothetical protein C5167_014585 [Papaver somniferum]